MHTPNKITGEVGTEKHLYSKKWYSHYFKAKTNINARLCWGSNKSTKITCLSNDSSIIWENINTMFRFNNSGFTPSQKLLLIFLIQTYFKLKFTLYIYQINPSLTLKFYQNQMVNNSCKIWYIVIYSERSTCKCMQTQI